jgi:hypothetical protein
MIAVGIDPGVCTGFAAWDAGQRRLIRCSGLLLHRALAEVEALHTSQPGTVVIFEDARLRTWFGSADARERKFGAAIREGVGSVKRDCTIWEEFLTDRGIPFMARKPQAHGTKWPAPQFAQATGWTARTNEHGRDAALLVFGMTPGNVESIQLQHVQRMGERAKASARP